MGVIESAGLTKREQECIGLALRGYSNQEIADQLVISVGTVKNHLHNAYVKLGNNPRTHRGALMKRMIRYVNRA